MRIGEKLTISAIILILGLTAFAFVYELRAYAATPPAQSTPWTPPPIAQCDLPLWERIRGECP
jgi:hypothetical protein